MRPLRPSTLPRAVARGSGRSRNLERRFLIAHIDSTENVGTGAGVQSVEPDTDFEPPGHILTADGAGGSRWRENTVGAAFSTIVLAQPSLWAYWPCDEASGDLIDRGPNGYDLAANTTFGTPVYGISGPIPPATAVDLGGGDFRATLTGETAPHHDVAPWTIVAIVRSPSNADANDGILTIYSAGESMGLYLSTVGGDNVLYALRSGDDVDAGEFPLNSWAVVAARYDGANLEVLVNGAVVDSVASSSNFGTLTDPVVSIGGVGSPIAAGSREYVSNVAVFTDALDDSVLADMTDLFLQAVAYVTSISKSGETPLKGDVTLTEGSNITITQTGQNISIALSAGGGVDSVSVDGDTEMTGDIKLAAGTGVTLTQDDVDTITIEADAGSSEWDATVTKTSDEVVNNSSTVQNDNELFFTAAANGVYIFELAVIYAVASGGTAADLKFGLGEDNTRRGVAIAEGSLSASDATQNLNVGCEQDAAAVVGVAVDKRVLMLRGWYVASGSGGTFRFVWAQNSALNFDLTVYADSYLRYKQIS